MTDKNEVEIDLSKACQKCGQMGATPSGLCLECIAENIVDWPKLVNEAIAKGIDEAHKLLATHQAQIYRAYRMNNELSIGMTLELAPSDIMPNAILVRSKINFVESRVKDQKTAQVSAQRPLPFGDI